MRAALNPGILYLKFGDSFNDTRSYPRVTKNGVPCAPLKYVSRTFLSNLYVSFAHNCA